MFQKVPLKLTELVVDLHGEIVGCYDESVFWVGLNWTRD